MHGPVSTGLALAAQSKAKRTARALARVEAKVATGGRLSQKDRLQHGVIATPAAVAHARALASAAAGRSRLGVIKAVDGGHVDQDHETVSDGRVGCRGLRKDIEQGRWLKGSSARASSAVPTHPSKLDPALAMDKVNWRPAASKSPVQHLPGYGSAGVCSVMLGFYLELNTGRSVAQT